jgi:hypothetical protein
LAFVAWGLGLGEFGVLIKSKAQVKVIKKSLKVGFRVSVLAKTEIIQGINVNGYPF